MTAEFEGRRALVTGSTGGIGRAAAQLLLDEGAHVTVSGRSEETVSQTRSALDPDGARTAPAVADLGTAEGVASVMGGLRDRGELDGLVVSHGGAQVPEPFTQSDPAGFADLAETMLVSNARLVHAAVPMLRQSAHGGRVVMVVSDAARYPTPGETLIGALAAANVMFTRTLARELAGEGIRLNAVAVTLTHDTPTYDRVMGASEFSRNLFEKAAARMPFAPVTADDVARTVVHLLSDDAAKITGQVVGVTGGLTT